MAEDNEEGVGRRGHCGRGRLGRTIRGGEEGERRHWWLWERKLYRRDVVGSGNLSM